MGPKLPSSGISEKEPAPPPSNRKGAELNRSFTSFGYSYVLIDGHKLRLDSYRGETVTKKREYSLRPPGTLQEVFQAGWWMLVLEMNNGMLSEEIGGIHACRWLRSSASDLVFGKGKHLPDSFEERLDLLHTLISITGVMFRMYGMDHMIKRSFRMNVMLFSEGNHTDFGQSTSRNKL